MSWNCFNSNYFHESMKQIASIGFSKTYEDCPKAFESIQRMIFSSIEAERNVEIMAQCVKLIM